VVALAGAFVEVAAGFAELLQVDDGEVVQALSGLDGKPSQYLQAGSRSKRICAVLTECAWSARRTSTPSTPDSASTAASASKEAARPAIATAHTLIVIV
jgi:hypothetical protein